MLTAAAESDLFAPLMSSEAEHAKLCGLSDADGGAFRWGRSTHLPGPRVHVSRAVEPKGPKVLSGAPVPVWVHEGARIDE